VTTTFVLHATARGIAIQELSTELEGDLDVRGLPGLDDSVSPGYEQIRIRMNVKADCSDEELTDLLAYSQRRYVLAFFQKLPPCLVGIEACATSHHWSRELKALGHIVRLMPPAYVKPYVKRQKNDAADAEAICEAVRGVSRAIPART